MPVQFAHTYDKILAAVNSGKRIIICRGGTSAAKTFSVLQYLVIRSLKYQEKTDIVAETIPALKKGVLSDLTNGGIAENLGIKWADLYNITSMIATMPSGGSLNFVAFENELQARGARRKNLFLNEANRIKWEVAEQLIMRTDGLIFIDFNPTAGFWVVDEFLQNPKYADQVCELVLTYKDNQHLAQSIVSFIESKRSNAAWWRVYVAEAMADCSEVALAFEDSVLRKMTSDEEKTFIAGGKIAKGKIILDFTGFKKSVIAKFYLNQLFLINQTRSTQWGIAGALIFRLKGIRELVANGRVFDKEASSKVTDSVKKGGTAEIDADDKIGGTDSVNSDIITQGRASIISDMAFAMDLTTSMLTREITTGGLSVDAEADIMAEAEVLEFYYYSICEPVINQLYGVSNVTYRADRWRSLESRLRALAMLEASEFWQKKSDEEKIKVWDELLGFQDTNSSSQ